MINSKPVFDRLTSILPIVDTELYSLYETALSTFWTADEVDLSTDVSQWNDKLTDNEKWFMSHILGFFVQSDQLVNLNLGDRFLKDIENIPSKYSKYARLFFNFQMAVEDIHTISYETMLDALLTDPKENGYYKNSIANIPCIGEKAKWAEKYINDDENDFPIRLIAFAILEGLFFSGSFCAIFWFETKNLLRGVVQYNKFISRDENLHYKFGLTLFRKLRDDPEFEFNASKDTINQMIKEAVEIETKFINESIPCSMVGMNTDLMTQYVKFIADQLLADIQMERIFKVENPFNFMVALGVPDKSNFFEVRSTVYSKPITTSVEYDSDASDF
jgi:ribonucleoside-diphosphate reductase subunit M2